jgi:hypothetical protein
VVAIAVQSAFSGKDKSLFAKDEEAKLIDPGEKKEELSSLYKDFGVVK